jgi:SAM-dependent methyltransferase
LAEARRVAVLRWARGHLPVEVRQGLRYVVGLGKDATERITGQADDELPPHRLRSVGAGDFRAIGDNMVRHFIDPGGLQPDHHVLDVGCGIGRMAIPLTRYLTYDGSYRGLDIRPGPIKWCRRNITPEHPNFQFDTASLRNTLYARHAPGDPATFKLPYPDHSFDFVAACSLFTHLLPAGAQNYLHEIGRVLRPGGQSFTTWFILNDVTREGASRNVGSMRFEVDRGDYAMDSSRVPEAALAYKEGALRGMLNATKLTIVEPIYLGSWSGQPDATTVQDVVIATCPPSGPCR